MTLFWRSGLVLIVAAIAVAHAQTSYGDVRVDCGNSTVEVRWSVGRHDDIFRIFLGSCSHPIVTKLPDGRLEIVFKVSFYECRIRRQMTGRWVTYKTMLTYKPSPKSQPPVFTYPVECYYRRSPDMFPEIQDRAFGTALGYGSLQFYMGIMNGDLSGPAQSSTFPLGSLIPVWAAVDQQAHLPLLLLLDECLATTSPGLDPSGPVYRIITNGGCLVDSKYGNSRFLPRQRSSELHLSLQAFRFGLGKEVYLHCKLVAWDPQSLDKGKKACHYNKELEGWDLLDDPSQSSFCSCCDSQCKPRERRDVKSGPQGITQKAILGPFTIVDGTRGNAEHQHPESERCPATEQEDWTP
ncbi:hypothetical protein AAFF_G00151860 [Aldrovandia affinis]|uniref:ZP domain-containing protein n=1 Tax=Aldrovandia affinis TaxID=143900 RepID=A0AAD7RRH7_9TELE|nr:hypothetical protein AAFF_G00151860 [Aldrovandia affinis]